MTKVIAAVAVNVVVLTPSLAVMVKSISVVYFVVTVQFIGPTCAVKVLPLAVVVDEPDAAGKPTIAHVNFTTSLAPGSGSVTVIRTNVEVGPPWRQDAPFASTA